MAPTGGSNDCTGADLRTPISIEGIGPILAVTINSQYLFQYLLFRDKNPVTQGCLSIPLGGEKSQITQNINGFDRYLLKTAKNCAKLLQGAQNWSKMVKIAKKAQKCLLPRPNTSTFIPILAVRVLNTTIPILAETPFNTYRCPYLRHDAAAATDAPS